MRRSRSPFSFFPVAASFLALFHLGFLVAYQAAAAPGKPATLAELEARVAALEARVQEIELLLSERFSDSSTAASSAAPAYIESDWRSLPNWGRVKLGMSFDQVVRILGKPTKSDMTSADLGTWYYEGYIEAAGANVSGSIFFVNRSVLSIRPPVW